MESTVVLILIFIMLALLVFTKIAGDFIFLGILTILLTLPILKDGSWHFGILSVKDALSGFSNPGLITIAFLYIVSESLKNTGAIDWIGQVLIGTPKTIRNAILRITIPVVGVSAFLNNTPVVSIMVPAITDLSKKTKISPSKLMLPMCYAATLGGICTLIGTSTNLVVNGMMIAEGRLSLGMFDIAWVGVPCAFVGILFLIFLGPILLPNRNSSGKRFENPKEYTIEMLVPKSSNLIGKTITEAGLRNLPSLFLVEIGRDDEVIPAVNPDFKLKEGDRLLFAGVVDSVKDLTNQRGLVLATDQVFKLTSPRHYRQLFEVVVSNSSPVVNKNIREAKFRTNYGAVVIAVARNNERIKKKIGDIVISPGDVLLIEATNAFYENYKDSKDFFLISPLEDSTPRIRKWAPLAIVILIAMITLVVLNVVDMLQASMLAAFVMIITRCITITQARKSLSPSILVIIAASLGIGKAIETSGLSYNLAHLITSSVHGSPLLSLIAIYIVTWILTELLTNNAAVALAFPIALQLADGFGISVIPYAVAVMIAGSAGFATPFGYQTNLMVYGPGGYNYSDYLKIGIPLSVIVGVVAILAIVLKWGF